MTFILCLCLAVCLFLTVLVVFLAEVKTGEVKSLMEQLRGESLKFHKTGEKKPPEQSEAEASLLDSVKSTFRDLLTQYVDHPCFSSYRREL